MDQSTPETVERNGRVLDDAHADVPALVTWALNHDLPGSNEDGPAPEIDPRWLPSFPMERPPEPERRSWMPVIIAGAAAAIATLLALWLFGLLGGDNTAAPPSDGDVVEVREIVAGADGATSAAAVGRKVTPSVVTVEVGDTAADGSFQQAGLGSGVVLSSDGYIVTNHHVIEEAVRIRVVVQDGTTYDAIVIGYDSRTDLAVVHIDAAGLMPIDYGQTDDLAIGDAAIAVGNPLGLPGGASLTVGVLSAFEREVTTADSGTLFGMLQTDAPITRGSSGGALVDNTGQLIGITTAIGVSNAGAEGIGFAVPIEIVMRVTDEIIETGAVRHAFLGVRLENHFEEGDGSGSRPAGATVVSFPAGVDSAAAGAGLRINDVIVGLDGGVVTTRDDLISALRRYRVGDTVTLDVLRDETPMVFDVVLGERPDDL